MFRNYSIQLKYSVIFLVALVMVSAGFFFGVQDLKLKQLRNEAQAVAEQVVSFRAWVAQSGVVWVDKLTPDFHDFLGQRSIKDGEMIFSKNPALATRELSTIVANSATRATFRVTSDEYRNPANAPDAFETEAIKVFKADDERRTFDRLEDGKYRFAQPVYVTKACLKCHGKVEDAPPEVIAKYGDQRAFGYQEGDVRGIISVNLPDISLADVTASFLNPYTITLLVLAFGLSFLYTQRAIIKRLKVLTDRTVRIAKGELDEPIVTQTDTADEIEHVAHAVDMLRRSLVVAMKHLKKG
jgi:HAMP domain-containing protein